MVRKRTLERFFLVSINVLLILGLLYTGIGLDIVDKRPLLLQNVSAESIIPDASIGYNFQLTSLYVTDENQATILDTGTGQVSTSAIEQGIRSGEIAVGPTTLQGTARASLYLVKDQVTTLTGADVRLQIPLLNYDSQLSETSPGVYSATLDETVTITPVFGEVSTSEARTWQIQPLSATFNSAQMSGSSVTDFIPDVTIPGDGSYESSVSLSLSARFLDDAGQPLANQTLTTIVGLPASGYTETISVTTDENGLATYTRTEPFTVTVTGGQVANLINPLSIPGANAESVQILAAWNEPPPSSDNTNSNGGSPSDQNAGAGADPINVTTGNFYSQEQDLYIAGRGLNLDFFRTYNNRFTDNGPFGYGWVHSYTVALKEQSDNNVIEKDEQGSEVKFTRNSDGTYTPPAGNHDTLTKLADGGFTLRDKHGVTKTFNRDGQLLRITDPNGNQITLIYSGEANPVPTPTAEPGATPVPTPTAEPTGDQLLAAVQDTVGRQMRFSYNSDNRIIKMTDPAGRTFAYTYDPDGNLTSVTYPDGLSVGYAYDSNHNLTVITNADGNRSFVGYNSDDRATSFSYEGDNHKITLSYDPDNKKTSVTDSRNNVWTYHYDFVGGTGVVTQIDNPQGGAQSWTWDSDVNRTSATDELNHKTTMTYDSKGNMLSRSAPLGNVVTFTYEPTYSRMTSAKDPSGATTELDYDSRGNLTAVTDALDNTTTYSNNSYGQMVSVSDPKGATTALVYDANGNLAQITDPDGGTTSLAYDTLGRLTSAADPTGATTSMAYDAMGQVAQVTQPDGSQLTFTYNGQGQKLTATDSTGATTRFAYDVANRLVSVLDPLGSQTIYTYDTEGNLTAVTDAKGSTTSYLYNPLNRLVRVTDAAGAQTGYQYDAAGNVTQIVDAKGNATAVVYDALNRPVEMTDALGNKQYYQYDARSKMTQFTNANGNATVYAYDALGRLARVTDPLGNATQYTYDAVGNLASRTDANGATTTYTYNALRRLTAISYPDGASVTSTYDAAGRLTALTNPAGAIRYQYDALGRVIAETQPGNLTMRYGYDSAGRKASVTDPYGRVIRYAYDDAGHVTSVTDPQGLATAYTYDSAGLVTSTTNPNNTSVSYAYDALNRLTRVVNTGKNNKLLSQFDYTYDALGNKVTATDQDGVVTAYTYDALNRLEKVATAGATGPLYATSYTYDAAGNRLTQTSGRLFQNQWSETTTAYYYDAADRLTSDSQYTYEWDANGNLLTKKKLGITTASYRYDYENRLVQADKVNYTYDALGRRIKRNEGNQSTQYIFNGQRVLMEIDGKSGQAVEYVADPAGRLISSLHLPNPKTQANDARYFQYDGLGNVVGRTNQQGSAVTSYSYDAFGGITNQSGQGGNAYTWMGQAYDASTGLYYMNARWYDPSVGRFITADPLPGNPFQSGSTNRYTYALDNPITYQDISGLTPAMKSVRAANSAQSNATSGSNNGNPNIWALVVIGLLLTIVILIVEILLIIAEIIIGALLAGITLTLGPIVILGVTLGPLDIVPIAGGSFVTLALLLLELILVAVSLFLVNLEVAWWVYVYRVLQAGPDQNVTLDLNPFTGWGLSP